MINPCSIDISGIVRLIVFTPILLVLLLPSVFLCREIWKLVRGGQ